MIVGVDTDILRGPMTGIANYTLNSLYAVLALEPRLQMAAFEGFGWRQVGSGDFARRALTLGKTVAAGNTVPPAYPTATSRVSRWARQSALARRLYRTCRSAAFVRSVRSRRLDLWHAVTMLLPADVGLPLLPVVYDLSYLRFSGTHPPDRVRQFERIGDVIRRAPRVQTISHFSRAEIANVFGYPAEQILVAPPAAGAVFRALGKDCSARDLEPFGLEFGGYFLAVGTLEPRKNLATLIEAYARLSPKQRSRFPLVVVGGKGWGDLALPKCTAGLLAEGSVRFLGFVPDAPLRSLYEGARLMLYPSLYEGFGMPVVEALACGAMVAHSEATAMDEISSGLAVRVCARDVAAWTEAMRDAIASDDDDGLRAARIARAQTFTWTRTAQAILQAYQEVARA